MKPIYIDGCELSEQAAPYIIAEISANHNGSLDRAKQTILAAKKAGVSAVKIQSYTPDTMTIESDNTDFWISSGLWQGRSLYDLYSEAHTPFEWHKPLFDYARHLGITIFSSPFDESAVDLLCSLDAPAYKVASFELIDLPLIAYIAQQGKPMLMSTGMASLDEIGEAIETARCHGCNDLAIFHCVSGYPTPIDQANLHMIQTLRDKFQVHVGLSDHTLGHTASTVATSLGAPLIEKHFTLSRADGGLDSAFSLEPAEMKKLVEICGDAYQALANSQLGRAVVERANVAFRRSLYFVKDLSEGELISKDAVRRIRPGLGLAPKFLREVIGQHAAKDIKRGDRVTWDSIKS